VPRARPPRALLVILVLLAFVLPVLVPSSASSHTSPTHYIQLTPTSYTVTYIDPFTGHCCYKMWIESRWSSVNDVCGWLHDVRFYYYDIQRDVYGGRFSIQHGYGEHIWKDADLRWQAPPYWEGYSTDWIPIQQQLCHGQAPAPYGRLAVIFTKFALDYGCNEDACWTHQSVAMMYR
jgi:hypothetical protein